jgi:hypothetical protein
MLRLSCTATALAVLCSACVVDGNSGADAARAQEGELITKRPVGGHGLASGTAADWRGAGKHDRDAAVRRLIGDAKGLWMDVVDVVDRRVADGEPAGTPVPQLVREAKVEVERQELRRVEERAAEVAATATPPSTAQHGKQAQRRVRRADLGDRWPLTVDAGTIHAEHAILGGRKVVSLVFVTDESRSFALNGPAQSLGAPGIEPIWRRDPRVPELRVNLQPLIDLGLELAR